MAEIEQEVKVYRVDFLCDACGEGKMEFDGIVLTSCPPQYPHQCRSCGDKKIFWSKYPHQISRSFCG